MTMDNNHTQNRLKYAATINNDVLSETTEPDRLMRYIDIGNVDSTGTIHEVANYRFENAPSRARRLVRDGDVIVSTVRTYLKAIAPITDPPDDLVVSTGFAVVRPKCDVLDPAFAKYLLRESRFLHEVQARSVGVSYPAINASDLGHIRIGFPFLDVQRSIADYLDAETAEIDALISEKERMLALLEEKRAALVTHAVTRGLDPQVKLKRSGLDWLGDIPAHWQVHRCAVYFRQLDVRCEPDLPLLNVSLNTGVTVRTFSEDRIEGVMADFNDYKVVRKGQLAFNKMRFRQGAGGIAPQDGLVSPDYTVAEVSEELDQAFVEYLVRMPSFNAEVRRFSHGIVDDRLRLYWDEFKAIRIPVPPLDEQKRISSFLDKDLSRIAKTAQTLQTSVTLLRERRSALITAAVTGRIRVEAMTACAPNSSCQQ